MTKKGHQEFWLGKLTFFSKKVTLKFYSKLVPLKPKVKSPPMHPRSLASSRPALNIHLKCKPKAFTRISLLYLDVAFSRSLKRFGYDGFVRYQNILR